MVQRFAIRVVGVGFLLGTFAGSANATAPEPYFYIVAAEPQLLWDQKDERNWKEAVRHINRLEPDFVIVCGDLIQGANESKAWSKPETVKALVVVVPRFEIEFPPASLP